MVEAFAQLINDYYVSHISFGDLYFEEVRAYREATEMIERGLKSRVSCVDTGRLPAYLADKEFDHAFLDALPSHIDPCGENGEFHTFVTDAPSFFTAIPISVNGAEEKDGLAFAVLVNTDGV